MERPTFVRRSARGLAAAAALAAAACADANPLVTVEGGLYAPKLDGHIGLASTITTDVDTIDLDSSLALGSRQYEPYLRGEVNLGGLDLAVSGFKTSQSGTGTVTADFGNISAGSTVDSKLDLGFVHAALCYDMIDTKWVTLGAGLGADYFDLDMQVAETAFALSESVHVKQGLPLLVARGVFRTPVLPLDLQIEASGITGHYQDFDGTLFDVEALLHCKVVGPLSVYGGYRFMHFDFSGTADNRSFDGNVALSGLLVGATVRF